MGTFAQLIVLCYKWKKLQKQQQPKPCVHSMDWLVSVCVYVLAISREIAGEGIKCLHTTEATNLTRW